MRVLIVDKTSEGQTALAKLFDEFSQSDQDTLDLSVSLAGEREFLDRTGKVDIILVGPEFGEAAGMIARRARATAQDAQILMMVRDNSYSSEMFRVAHTAGVRKVLPESASSLDLLQELVSIHEEHKLAGRAKSGRVIAVTQAKGGVGATTFCAALAECCNEQGRSSMLWDFDLETRDLSRALSVDCSKSAIIEDWIDGKIEISRQSLRDALTPLAENSMALTAPPTLSAGYKLSGSTNGAIAVQRIIDLARYTHDNVIVDLSGRLSPGAEAVLRAADIVVVVVDDSILGLSAAHELTSLLTDILKGPENLRFVCSGVKLSVQEIAAHLSVHDPLPEGCFCLPVFPFEPAAATWAGTGKTVYRGGRKETKAMIEAAGKALGLLVDWHEPLRFVTETGKTKIVSQRAQNSESEQRGALRGILQRVAGLSLS